MGHKCRPRVPDGTHGLREGAKTSPKGAGRHSRATGRDINVAQGYRAVLTGNRNGHKCRPRVPGGTHGQREGAEMSPKGAGRHSRATGWDINVAQGCRAALTGDGKGHKRRPRVQGGTHRQKKGAETSPKGVARHSRATGRDINVAQGCRTVLTGYGKGRKRRPRVSPGTHRLRKGAKTLLEGGRNEMRGGKILSGPRYLCGLELLSRGKDRFLEYSCQVHIWFKLRKFHESLRIIVMIDHFTDSVDFLLGLVFGDLFLGSPRHLQP